MPSLTELQSLPEWIELCRAAQEMHCWYSYGEGSCPSSGLAPRLNRQGGPDNRKRDRENRLTAIGSRQVADRHSE